MNAPFPLSTADPNVALATAPGTRPSITDWLANATADSTVFASPTTSLLGRGSALHCQTGDREGELPARVAHLLQQATRQGVAQPVALGTVPFGPGEPGFFRVPERLQRGAPLAHPPLPPPVQASANRIAGHHLQPAGAAYEAMVRAALRQLDAGEAEKIVLARRAILRLQRPLERAVVLHNMLQANPAGYTFWLPLESEAVDDPETFFGISPELLVRRSGACVITNPLAGTCARDPDPAIDRARAQALLHSEKDRREHAYVVAAVRAALAPWCRELHVPAAPSLSSTHNLWHLSTRITGELRAPHARSLELALALHPTPAVCGTPTARAMQAIERLEPFARGLYAGMVGWENSTGDGEWAVAIRCAHYRARALTLTAGAGLVAGSNPVQERRETGNKLRSLLATLGLEHAADILQETA